MVTDDQLLDALDARTKRRDERRAFFKTFGAVAGLTGGTTLAASAAQANPAAPNDADIFNFALNLEYLEANFYSFVATGGPIPVASTGGTGNPGAATGGRQVTFQDATVAAFAREVAADERAHVDFIRSVLKTSAVAQPTIDLSVSPTSAFSQAARAAGLIGANESFDPYAGDINFLLAAFIFEDTGVTAYKGSAQFISNKTYLEAAAGILAVEAYHAAFIRTTLFVKGLDVPRMNNASDPIYAANQISGARNAVDGPVDDDQGITVNGAANLVPTDANSLAFGRAAANVLNIAYITPNSVSAGGFFPNGVNGTITTSGAN